MTNTWLLCATTAVALIATPALADSELQQGPQSPQVSEPAQAQPSTAPDAIGKALRERNQAASPSAPPTDSDRSASAGEDEQGGQAGRMAQQRLRAALKKAGFTDVRIVDTTYMVKARDENGHTVLLSINPSSMNHGAMGRGAMNHDVMNHSAMNRDGMNRDAMNGDERDDVADSGGGYGAEAADETRGEVGDFGQGRGEGRWGGGHRAFERAYERGFRDGYSRGFDSAQRR